MYYRITNSLITVLILSLAVAFLGYVLFFGVLSYDTEYTAYRELKERRQLGSWIVRLSTTDTPGDILRAVKAKNAPRLAEYAQWGNLTPTQMDRLEDVANDVNKYTSYFDRISQTSRAVLIADTDPLTLAERLGRPGPFDEFIERAENLKLSPPLGSKENLQTFISKRFPFFREITLEIKAGQLSAIDSIQGATSGQPLHRLFAQGNESFYALLTTAGYSLEKETFDALSTEAKAQMDMEMISATLNDPRVGPKVAREMNVDRVELNLNNLFTWLNSQGKATWLKNQATELDLSADRLLQLAKSFRRSSQLQKVVGDSVPVKRAGIFSLEQRTLWLILVSFLVCLVGITNTMLMSVTARFSEIATMKCLGAMDSFIMQLFVYEAMLQGVVGSALGVVLGLFLAFLRSAVGYGGLVFEAINASDLFLISVLSFLTGIVIAALAAMWPSWTASRLAPMEAMRVE